MSDLRKALDYTFQNEGGFANVKGDRGGATKYGITIGTLARWRKHPVSVKDVQALTLNEAMEIYEHWYWRPVGCHHIKSDAVATALFDIGVVRGVGVPVKYAQEILGCAVDGHMGPITLGVINNTNPNRFLRAFAVRVEQGFDSIVRNNPSQQKFQKGWRNRARRLLTLLEPENRLT